MKKLLLLIMSACLLCSPAQAQLPVSGIHVPQLTAFDDIMQSMMQDNGIAAGVLAVSEDGVVVYQRGFGVDVPENMPMRLASVSKSITAAAVHRLVADGAISLIDRVFDLGSGNGILPHQPWQGLGDPNIANIRVIHLLDHRSGWNHGTLVTNPPIGGGDPQFHTVEIANAMGIPAPAGRDDIIRFMLSQPLQYTPGTDGCMTDSGTPTYCYSNFGYMLLGRIVEVTSGLSLHEFVRQRIITPQQGVPHQELFTGRTLLFNQDPREPLYQCTNCSCQNVFDPTGPLVPCPYGGFYLEAFIGHGNLVAGAVPLIRFMENYRIAVQGTAGLPLGDTIPGGNFAGSIDGSNTAVIQRSDGINIVVLFSKRDADLDQLYALTAASLVSAEINGLTDLPSFAVDGFWVDFHAPADPIEVGGYNHPLRTVQQAIDVGAGAKWRLKPGTSNWTGTIEQQVIIDAPFGDATIGN